MSDFPTSPTKKQLERHAICSRAFALKQLLKQNRNTGKTAAMLYTVSERDIVIMRHTEMPFAKEMCYKHKVAPVIDSIENLCLKARLKPFENSKVHVDHAVYEQLLEMILDYFECNIDIG